MARPIAHLPEDVLAQRLYLGAAEREALHKLVASGCPNLSLAARLLIQQGAASLAAELDPGEHSVTSESLQRAEVRVALDLSNAAHLRAFKRLNETIAELDRETKESLQ